MDTEDVWGSKHNEIDWISILEKIKFTCFKDIHVNMSFISF